MNDMKYCVRGYYYWVYSGVAKIGVSIDEAEIGIRRQILPMHYVDGHGVPTSLDPVLTDDPNDNWRYPRTKGNFKFPANNEKGLIAFAFDRIYQDLPCDLKMVGMTIYGDPDYPTEDGFMQLDKDAETKRLLYGAPVTQTITVEELINRHALNTGNNYGTTEIVATQTFLYFDTNIPFFDTVEHAKAYINSGGNTLTGLLNGDEVLPEDTNHEYFIKNAIYKNGSLYRYSDYKFKTTSAGGGHKLYLLASNDTIGYDLILHGQHDSTITEILSRNRHDPANAYAPTPSAETEYLRHDQSTVGGDTYKASFFSTNIYIFSNQAAADDYVNSGDTSGAINKEAVNRANDSIVDGHIGDVVSQTDNGSSGISFAYGGQIYALSSVNLAAFFTNVLFSTDTSIKDAILEGTQLFGANQINAINGVMYLPISDISDIASVSSVNKCFIGTYEAPITAQRVVANDKMINCGSAQFDETYGDFRDYEPFCKLGVLLPYIGFKELSISKYINKTVSLKYAVDVTTGACTAYLYANGVIMDSFDGTMGVQRPITAVNQQAQVSAVINGILGTATQAAKTIGTAGTTAVAGATLAGASSVAEAAPQAAKFAGGQSQIGGGAINTILSGYSTLNAAIDSPISTRGAYSGVLGEFGNQYPYFIFAWLKTSKPANEIETIGLPSNAGGAVGTFGGFLQCAAFNLANGFGGTDTEAEEIYSIMRNGVYVS